jgi:site-specific DNA recombinase
VKTAVQPQTVRVAIYCRQSVASDLEFGSIDAQREAVEAYVQSQRGEGWVALPTRYDDHGFSGGSVERPSFQRLVADVQAGKVDVIAAYKIDRISRSLPDFTGFMSLLEKHGVGFVSTTQAFDTRTSMGRLTLNILASFSQFEREVISERIRDKMQATRRKGMWTGGRPVLGYDVVAKKLVVNADEADQVRAIFDLYIERGSIGEVMHELRSRGWRNKTFTGKRGQAIAGREFTKATLHGLLTNPLYRGQITTKEGPVAGEHEAIVTAEAWDAVQAQLASNRQHGGADVRNKSGALLRGLLRCGRCGSTMIHTFTTRGTVRNRYYTCSRTHNEGKDACPGCRIPAGKFEGFVAQQIRAMGVDEALLNQTAAAAAKAAVRRRRELELERRRLLPRVRADGDDAAQARADLAAIETELAAIGDGTVDPDRLALAISSFEPVWNELFPREQERILRLLIAGITYHPDTGDADIELRPCGIETLASEARP